MKNARRKLEIPMPAAMPCKTPMKSSGETYRGIGKSKTKDRTGKPVVCREKNHVHQQSRGMFNVLNNERPMFASRSFVVRV